MRPNCRSSGVATDDAIVSGLAPGSDAETAMVGKSTCGSGDTGSSVNAAAPAGRWPTISSVVAIGRRMNGSEMFTRDRSLPRGTGASDAPAETVEPEINDGGRVKRQQLAHEQAADDGDAKGRRNSEPVPVPSASGMPPSSAASVVIMIGRNRSRLASRIASSGCLCSFAFGFEREVDHHDRVLLHDADEQHETDERDDAEVGAGQSSRTSAPTPADGSVDRIVSGCT